MLYAIAVISGPVDTTITVRVDNCTRSALLHLPPSIEDRPEAASLPLVLNWHGMCESPQEQQGLSDLDRVADKFGFVVAYPQGGAKAVLFGKTLAGYTHNGGGCCSAADSKGVEVDDVAFARALVAAIAKVHPIDLRRVYSTGFSNGGFMSHRLACDASDIFAAIAPVSSVLATAPNPIMKSEVSAYAL